MSWVIGQTKDSGIEVIAVDVVVLLLLSRARVCVRWWDYFNRSGYL